MNTASILRHAGWVFPGLFLVVGLLVDKIISGAFFITGALGIFVALRYGQWSFDREEKYFGASFAGFAAASLIAALAAGEIYPRTLEEMEACARYLLAVPVFLFIRWSRPRLSLILAFVMAGSAAAGLYGLYHILTISEGGLFVYGGVRHHIRFGVGAVTLGFISIAAYGLCRNKGKAYALLPFAALILGLAGAVASGSRTSWIALPFLFLIVVLMPKVIFPLYLRAGLGTALVLAGITAWFVPATGVAERVRVGIENVQGYGEERGHISSLGARLEMWKASALIFRERPLLGAGVAGYQPAVEKLVEKGLIRPTTERYVHPHNEYFSVAASRGIIGLAALLFMFICPAYLFIRALRYGKYNVAAPAYAGLVVVAGFAVFGLSHALSARTFYITYYTMLVALFYGMVRAELQDISSLPDQKLSEEHSS